MKKLGLFSGNLKFDNKYFKILSMKDIGIVSRNHRCTSKIRECIKTTGTLPKQY